MIEFMHIVPYAARFSKNSILVLETFSVVWYASTKHVIEQYGAYGVTVNTGACGALDKGSIPFRHPEIRSEAT